MYEVSKSFFFDAAHTLAREVEAESSRRIHGHTYLAEVMVRGRADPQTGMVIDLGLLEMLLAQVREGLDHHFLDEVPGLGAPTMENLCAWIWRALARHVQGLARVTISRQSSRDSCSYFGPTA